MSTKVVGVFQGENGHPDVCVTANRTLASGQAGLEPAWEPKFAVYWFVWIAFALGAFAFIVPAAWIFQRVALRGEPAARLLVARPWRGRRSA